MLHRPEASFPSVRLAVVIVPPKRGDLGLCVIRPQEQMHAQAFVPGASAEERGENVLRWCADTFTRYRGLGELVENGLCCGGPDDVDAIFPNLIPEKMGIRGTQSLPPSAFPVDVVKRLLVAKELPHRAESHDVLFAGAIGQIGARLVRFGPADRITQGDLANPIDGGRRGRLLIPSYSGSCA